MRPIPRSYIMEFSARLDDVSQAAKAKMRQMLYEVDLSDIDSARAQIADIMGLVVGASDAMASTMAAGFYDGIREYQTGAALGATADSGWEPDSTKRAVYGITDRLAKAETPSISMVEGLLVQRIGYEVKRSAGRTMYSNGQRDPNKPKFARIPMGGDSCEFCRMLASRGFAYNSEKSAGKHNPDHYHDGCRCEVVCSWEKDPRIDGMEEGEYNLRAWDQYGGDSKKFAERDHSQHKQHQQEKRRNRYTDDGKLKAGYSGLRIDKQVAYTEADRKKVTLMAAAQRGNTQRGSVRRRNNASSVGYEGSFGPATAVARTEYVNAGDKLSLFNRRNNAKLEMEGTFTAFSDEGVAALFAGIEYGGAFVGTAPSRVKLVSTNKIKKGILAQVERRENDDVIIRVSKSRLSKLTPDEIEQVLFHEMAHTAEYKFTSFKAYQRETDKLRSFQRGEIAQLKASAFSQAIEKALQDAGISACYSKQHGKIVFKGESGSLLHELPEYAYRRAEMGMQDSELAAECLRFVALHGQGKNAIADTIYEVLLEGK